MADQPPNEKVTLRDLAVGEISTKDRQIAELQQQLTNERDARREDKFVFINVPYASSPKKPGTRHFPAFHKLAEKAGRERQIHRCLFLAEPSSYRQACRYDCFRRH